MVPATAGGWWSWHRWRIPGGGLGSHVGAVSVRTAGPVRCGRVARRVGGSSAPARVGRLRARARRGRGARERTVALVSRCRGPRNEPPVAGHPGRAFVPGPLARHSAAGRERHRRHRWLQCCGVVPAMRGPAPDGMTLDRRPRVRRPRTQASSCQASSWVTSPVVDENAGPSGPARPGLILRARRDSNPQPSDP